MDFALDNNNYQEALKGNVTNKLTKSNQDNTTLYLKKLYGFEDSNPFFTCFKYFWQKANLSDRVIISLLYACKRDFLLAESIEPVINTTLGEKVAVDYMEQNIEAYHPGRFTPKTRKSAARNIISSWKQAGYITGKIKALRTKVKPGYYALAFAMLLAYLSGSRGDFILQSKWVRALDLPDAKVRELAVEAAQQGLVQYQFAGSVTAISFDKILTKLKLSGFESR
ncbi:hypothetical protein AAE02nite_10230 [Adhaeribacter aerolatus]|uniref:Uncharacterized protein n=2 Tax=Adhaeribacter aerolatus TaxID=670289 RepID=A0A512AUG8_9BACT|nr:hypothetical protein AAE02nite_10230 [Adhaeribacter aerolatus]